MKALMATLTFLLVSLACIASITDFSLLDNGRFAGKTAVYASGDTIVYVLRSETTTALGEVKYYYSYNGGDTWNWSSVLPTDSQDYLPGAPTLCYTPEEQIVVTQKYLSKSTNGGVTWQNPSYISNRSFDNSPILEKRNGAFRYIHVNMPYPEDRQDEFTIPGTDEFAIPQTFTDISLGINDENVYYRGNDVINGHVRINGNLQIKQAGGDPSNPNYNYGWPTFNGPVVVAGEVHGTPENYNVDQVFPGGLIEHAPKLELPDTFRIYQNGRLIGDIVDEHNRIYYVEVEGSTISGWVGYISPPRRVHADVWANYPMGTDSPPEYRNNFTVRDTVWTPLTGLQAHPLIWVNGKLWIKGNFSGKQTWLATDTLYVVGDITLSGTVPGESPLNNTVDSVNLISEKSVLLKYGFANPADSTRIHPLCASDNDPHMVYASLFAMGDGNGNPRKDGVFTFEYQHPHGSIPATVINVPDQGETLFDWIDLHRNHWPQTVANPWPSWLDYPWYNPLWPERSPYLERGTIQLWGSVVQQRQGYLHRNYYDNEYPSGGVWNPDIDYCGGTSSPANALTIPLNLNPAVLVTLQTRHFPGATGSGIGYKRDYHADNRLSFSSMETPGLEGFWRLGLSLASLNLGDYVSDYETYYLKPQTRKTYAKSFARKGLMALYSVNDLLLSATNDDVTDISAATNGDGNITSTAIGNDNTFWISQMDEAATGYLLTVKQISASGSVQNTFADIEVPTKMNDLTVLPNGRVILAIYETSGMVQIIDLTKGDEGAFIENWSLIDSATNQPLTVWEECKLSLIPSGAGNVEVFAWIKAQNSNNPLLHSGSLFHARTSFPVSIDDPEVPSIPQIVFSAYPNPMSNELKLSVELSQSAQTVIDIYNLKGQKVRSLAGNAQALSHQYLWNGCDASDRKVSSGIYLLKLKVDGKVVQTKRICRY